MSRQYLARLMDNGDIPFRHVGTHRKLRELTKLSEEFGGYDPELG